MIFRIRSSFVHLCRPGGGTLLRCCRHRMQSEKNITSLSFSHIPQYFNPLFGIWQLWQEETVSCTLILFFISQAAGAKESTGRSILTRLWFNKSESDQHCCLRASSNLLWLLCSRCLVCGVDCTVGSLYVISSSNFSFNPPRCNFMSAARFSFSVCKVGRLTE